jgi:PAS domain S-box-containing protein
LLQIHRAIQNMVQASNLETVLHTIYDQLQRSYIRFASLSIHHIINENTSQITSYRIVTTGGFWTNTSINKGTVADWKNGTTLYRPDTENDPQGLPEDYLRQAYQIQGIHVRSMLNVPFKQGVLVLRSEQVAAFSPEDIHFIEQISETLSLGVSRAEDFSKQEAQFQALQQSEDFLNQAQSIAHVGNWTLDIKTGRVSLSNELCRIYGLDPSETPTTFDRIMELIHPDDRKFVAENTRRFAETGLTENNEFRVIRPNGGIANLYGQAKTVTNSEGQAITLIGTVQDITERKQMEAERERTQRLRALGEMVAGISHNLNNILTGILGPAQMLQLTHQDPQVLEEVDTIITAGLRARDIVSRLNKGWRTDTETLEATDINQAISEAIQAARPRWKDAPESRGLSIEVHPHLADVPHIQGTQSGLYDIIINLIFNAADVMPKGGLISLTTIQTKDHVRLLVSDTGTGTGTGTGMSAETLERIFNPFFTTKGEVGTGLGLSTVYGTINRWGGKIDVASTLGQGTTFTLDFAIWEGDEIERTEQAPQKATGRTCRILIVEDDEIVTRVLDRTLSSHQIDTVSSSQEALEIFAPNTYDVLITDLGLPHLPGDQLAQQLRQKDPNLITILISGWELLPTDPRRAHFFAFVQKLFTT